MEVLAIRFQSTPPVWGATKSGVSDGCKPPYFNPRPPCGGRPVRLLGPLWVLLNFNPRPPCGGRRRFKSSSRTHDFNFNPRPPCGGRLDTFGLYLSIVYFNPRPPCGGRQQKQLKIQAVRAKNRQFLQISSPNSYPILKNKVASLQIILQNLVRDLGDFLRVYVSHLKHQYIFWVVGCLYSKMLDLVFIAVSQVIKTKTVLFRVHDLTQLCL